jgi:hypothetical protein
MFGEKKQQSGHRRSPSSFAEVLAEALASLSYSLLSDNPAIRILIVSDNKFSHRHHTLACKGALDSLLVSHAGGESNHAITRGQYALAAQTEAGKAIVTIETGLSGSVNAWQKRSWSHHLQILSAFGN